MWSCATQGVHSTALHQLLLRQPAGCCSKLLGVELLPVMLLAIQELAARAATRDQHLRSSAQLFVPEITSKIWVLTWQRPLKFNFLLYLECDCRPGLAGRVLTARSFLD